MSKQTNEKKSVKKVAARQSAVKQSDDMVTLRRIRMEKGLSRHQLSMATDISIRNIEVYEQGRVDLENVAYHTIKTLADALGVTTEELVYGK